MTVGNQDVPAEDRIFLRQTTEPRISSGTSRQGTAPLDDTPVPDLNAPGHTITTEAAELNAWDRYCALALQVDALTAGNIPDALDKAVMQLIDAAKQTHGAIGGRYEEPIYFCALPDMDMDAGLKFAQQMLAELTAQRPETISVGLAPFPLLDYTTEQSWTNTCKALHHASFLGPGSIVALDAVTLNISGDQHYQNGNTRKAISEYSAALELDPNNTNVRNSLGVCFAELKDMAAARSCFTTVSEIDTVEPMAKYNLGMLFRLENQDPIALENFKEAYAVNSDFFEIPFQIGQILTDQGRWEDALVYLDKAIDLRQDQNTVHSLKGDCLFALEMIPEAIDAYRKAVKLNPNNAGALSALGCLYGAQNENPDICALFLQQSVALEPNNGLFHHRMGLWYEKNEQWEEAEAAYRQASAWGHDATRQLESVKQARQTQSDQATRRAG